MRSRRLYLALFLAGVLISGFTILRELDPFDEGLMLQAARRVADGQMPYRDFLCPYGPAQPYLLGALFKAFGVSMLDWRILRVLTDAAVGLVVYAIVRREAGPRWALAGWLAAVCAMAEPRSASSTPLALLAGLAAIYLATRDDRRLGWAAVLTAVAAAFRLDFAIYAGAGVLAALLLGRLWRPALVYAATSAGLTLLVYLPFLIAIGPADLYDALVGSSLRERDYWTLPFPLHYPGALGGLRDAKDALDYYVPALLVAGIAIAAVAGLARLATRRRLAPVWAALLVFAAGALAYVLSRADNVHTTPLLVILAALLPIVAARAADSGARLITAATAAVLVLLLAYGAWNRASALLRPPDLDTVNVAVADGVKAPRVEARGIEAMVGAVQRRVPPGRPIYAVTERSDLVLFNNPLIYVLTERDNPTRRDFGLQTGAPAQSEIVATLERVRPQAIVRWTDPISTVPEANLRGRPSGVHTLDDFLRAEYRPAERNGHYEVWEPR
jgi:hypothetical protein